MFNQTFNYFLIYAGLLHWQFIKYADGEGYLTTYQFQNFRHMNVYPTLANFFIVLLAALLVALGPRPNILRRRRPDEALTMARPVSLDNRFSVDSDLESIVSRMTTDTGVKSNAETIITSPSGRKSGQSLGALRSIVNGDAGASSAAPVLFMRDAPSGAATVSLSFRPSASLNMETDESINRGPTVTVQSLTVSILDPRSPLGHKQILSDVSAKFDWGKLCVIMGAKDSGKSTLLHLLSGADNRPTTTISGISLDFLSLNEHHLK